MSRRERAAQMRKCGHAIFGSGTKWDNQWRATVPNVVALVVPRTSHLRGNASSHSPKHVQASVQLPDPYCRGKSGMHI